MIQFFTREDLKLLQKDDKLLENGEMCETNLFTKGDRLDFHSMMNGYPKPIELLKLLKPNSQSSFNWAMKKTLWGSLLNNQYKGK